MDQAPSLPSLPDADLIDELVASLEAAGFVQHGLFLRSVSETLDTRDEQIRELNVLLDAQQDVIENQADTILDLRTRLHDTLATPAEYSKP